MAKTWSRLLVKTRQQLFEERAISLSPMHERIFLVYRGTRRNSNGHLLIGAAT
jgi:hypothetical protein